MLVEVLGVTGFVVSLFNLGLNVYVELRRRRTEPVLMAPGRRGPRPDHKPRVVVMTEEREAEIEENRNADKV
jgi:hypothetical protein